MAEQDTSGTVARVVALMQELAGSSEGLALGDLAAALSLPPSTVHRLLKLLASSGIVERTSDGNLYQAGREFYRIALLVANHTRTREVVRPILQSVWKVCSEACLFCEYLPASGRFMTIYHVRSGHALRYEIVELQPQSLLWGATGRSILAFLPDRERERVMAMPDRSPMNADPPKPAELKIALDEIRAKGFATTHGQRIPGAIGIGAPVFRAGGEVFGSLCITAPAMRFPPDLREQVAKVVVDHARQLSEAFGWRGSAQTVKQSVKPRATAR